MMRFLFALGALALGHGSVVLAQSSSDDHAHNAYTPVSSNPCGECTVDEKHYGGGWWTTGDVTATVSIEAVTVMIYTNNQTNTTRTSTIFNFPPDASISQTNSDGFPLATQEIKVGESSTTTVTLTWPTGYVQYQWDQTWSGTLPVTLGAGLNATTTCLTEANAIGTGTPFPTTFAPVFPTPVKGASGDTMIVGENFDRNSFYIWQFMPAGGFADCQWPFDGSYALDYWSALPNFPVYQTCWGPATAECGAGAIGTQQYLTVTSHAADPDVTPPPSSSSSTPVADSIPSQSPSPVPTTSPGPPKTSSHNPTPQSQEQPSSTSQSSVEPPKSSSTEQASPNPPPQSSKANNPPPQSSKTDNPPAQSSKADNPPAQSSKADKPPPQSSKVNNPPPQSSKADNPPTEVDSAAASSTTTASRRTSAAGEPAANSQSPVPIQSSTATSFRVTTNQGGTTVAVVNTKSEATSTLSSFRTTTDSNGKTVAVVQPANTRSTSSTATSFRLTTNQAGTTVAVVGTGSGEQTTFTSFRTTTDESGSTVAVVQPVQSSSTISSFKLTTDAAGSTIAIISSESTGQQTFASFRTTTNKAGETVAVVEPAGSSTTSSFTAETLTTETGGQTAAVVTGTSTIPIASFTSTRVEGGSTQTLTGTAALPNSGGKPFLLSTDGTIIAATPTTDANGHTIIEIATQSTLPIVTDSAGSSFVESVGTATTTITGKFTYTSGTSTVVVTPSKGHSVVTYATTKSIPLASSSSTDVGGYVASGLGITPDGGQGSSGTPGPSSTGVEQVGTNAAARPMDLGSGHILLLMLSFACVAAWL